jgi:hypothetical protein
LITELWAEARARLFDGEGGAWHSAATAAGTAMARSPGRAYDHGQVPRYRSRRPDHEEAPAMTEPGPRPAAPYGDFQLEIYLAGLGGTTPSLPVSFAELESRAAHALPPSVLSYVAGGAGDEHTQRANVAAPSFPDSGFWVNSRCGTAIPGIPCGPAAGSGTADRSADVAVRTFDGVALNAPQGTKAESDLVDLAARRGEAAEHDATSGLAGGANLDRACSVEAAVLLGLAVEQ